MDGNGRWAENQGLLRFDGHRAGVAAVKTVIKCCLNHQIPILSLFAFGYENWRRPEKEVEFLMSLFLEALSEEVVELNAQGIALRFIGMRAALSETLQEQMAAAELLTRNNTQLHLNVVINYSGQWDILAATKAIATKVESGELTVDEIDEALFSQHLSTHLFPDPDLFIRTSGELRISNFFLWQLAYTEFYFTSVHWPDFNEDEFNNALISFSQRERRYGKTSHQLIENTNV